MNAKVVGVVLVAGQMGVATPPTVRMISIVAFVASALVSSLSAKHEVEFGFSKRMFTLGVKVVVSLCEQLTAILKLVAFTREVSPGVSRQASGLALPNERLEGTDKLQVL